MKPENLLLLLVLVPIAVAVVAVAPLRAALGRVMRQRAFLGAVALLGVAAVGLNAATQAMKVHFRKQSLELSVPRLDDAKQGIPEKVGKWVQVSIDEPLNHTTQEVLGTGEFVFRDYVDSTAISPEDLEWFKDKSGQERARKVAMIQEQQPDAVVRLAITYYTGGVDTVPHVPEKCYVADGFNAAGGTETLDQTLGEYADGSPRKLSYRFIQFEDTTGLSRVDRNVAYTFHVNGRYESSNLGVRKELANLFQRYGYFAKVELMATGPAAAEGLPPAEREAHRQQNRATSVAAFNDILTAILPELERCLPDWKKVAKQ